MKEIGKNYYFKNGRLDLSVLEECKTTEKLPKKIVNHAADQEPKLYMDEKVCSVLEEMSNYFLEEEKN